MKILQSLWLLGYFLLSLGNVAEMATPVDNISAKSVILLEAHTGQIIYEQAAKTRLYPASTTKMTTLLLALERGQLDDVITVGDNAAGTEGSSLNLMAGDQLYLRDLLYGIMLMSGNDATIAVAEALAGSVEEFARQMTEKAHEIGANDTNFVNSCGLPDPQHYSTAYDLAKIAMYGYRNAKFREIVETKQREIQWIAPARREILENTNLLLDSYVGCNGIKTGYTEAAGECLVASAERDGVDLIVVLMNVDQDHRWAEAAALFDYGFTQVKLAQAYDKNSLVQTVHVQDGKNYKITVRPANDIFVPVVSIAEKQNFAIRINVPDFITAPVQAGQAVGYVELLYKNQSVEQIELFADQTVESGFSVMSLLVGWYDKIKLWYRLIM